VPGDQDDLYIGLAILEACYQIKAVDVGHADIANNNIRALIRKRFKPLITAVGMHYPVAHFFEESAYTFMDNFFVINEQQLDILLGVGFSHWPKPPLLAGPP
jgi:hypothetical protein